MGVILRPWIILTSSSGETFTRLFESMRPETQQKLSGIFVDRPCHAALVARKVAPEVPLYELTKAEFEEQVLAWIEKRGYQNAVIFLCGFFGILSADFLNRCPCPVVNTHPSLLPSFPGLEMKVHQKVFDSVPLSGFTLHLVTADLDGGPILFQHPVSIDGCSSWEDSRKRVRAAEQKWLPRVLEHLLKSSLTSTDRLLKSSEVRLKLNFNTSSFEERS